MSNTSAALTNARYAGHRSVARHWLVEAMTHLREDLAWPAHIRVTYHRTEPALVVCCERCSKAEQVSSVAAAADYRDAHWHCGETHCNVWRCTTCDHWAFEYEKRCRFCDASRGLDGPRGVMPVVHLLNQRFGYDVYLAGEWRAYVRCNSLLRAKRAARAMYVRREATVATPFGSWSAG